MQTQYNKPEYAAARRYYSCTVSDHRVLVRRKDRELVQCVNSPLPSESAGAYCTVACNT